MALGHLWLFQKGKLLLLLSFWFPFPGRARQGGKWQQQQYMWLRPALKPVLKMWRVKEGGTFESRFGWQRLIRIEVHKWKHHSHWVDTLTVRFRSTCTFMDPLNITTASKPIWCVHLGPLSQSAGFLLFASKSDLVLAVKMDTHAPTRLTCTPQSWIPQILAESLTALAELPCQGLTLPMAGPRPLAQPLTQTLSLSRYRSPSTHWLLQFEPC